MEGLRLSVLDQSPVPEGSTPGQALQNSIELAKLVDGLGYRRYWMSEHHAMDLLACTAPEIMLARIGAETKRIRIGSGGIMLPHYTPLKVAEVFRTLHALYPGRVDLGIGRAPGGGPMEALALKRERKTPMQDDFPEQVSELLAFSGAIISCGASVWEDSGFAGDAGWAGCVDAGVEHVELGGGGGVWAALFVCTFFLVRCIRGHAIETYRRNFRASGYRSEAEATVAVGVICAETQEEAEYLASSVRLLQRRIRMNDRRPVASPEDALRELRLLGDVPMEEGEWPRYFVGTPALVKEQLEADGWGAGDWGADGEYDCLGSCQAVAEL